MWRPPKRTFPAGHHPPRMPTVDSRMSAKAKTKPVSMLNRTFSVREVASYPSTSTATASWVARPAVSRVRSALSRGISGLGAPWRRLLASRIPSPSMTVPAVARATPASPRVNRSARRAPRRRTIRASRRLMPGRSLEANEVWGDDASRHAAEVEDELRVAHDALVIHPGMCRDDADDVGAGELLVEVNGGESVL